LAAFDSGQVRQLWHCFEQANVDKMRNCSDNSRIINACDFHSEQSGKAIQYNLEEFHRNLEETLEHDVAVGVAGMAANEQLLQELTNVNALVVLLQKEVELYKKESALLNEDIKDARDEVVSLSNELTKLRIELRQMQEETALAATDFELLAGRQILAEVNSMIFKIKFPHVHKETRSYS